MKKVVKTHCGRMDHGGCTLLVEVEDGRLAGIRPDPDGALSKGHICPKAKALIELHHHPQRLRRPLRRKGARGSGQWEEIPWPEALGLVAEGLTLVKEKYGGRGVAFCQGSPKGLEHFVLIRLANTFGSPNVVGPQNVCHMPREISGLLTCGFFPVADYDEPTQAVLVWGSNLTATNEEGVICTRLLGRWQADRPPLVVIDPRRTELAGRADLWLPVRPGADAALALGLLNVIIRENLYDEDFVRDHTHGFKDLAAGVAAFTPENTAALTGLPPEDIIRAARLYGRARPGLIQWGNGIEQTVHNFDASRALVCLMAVCGNLDVPGGNVAAAPPPLVRLGEFVRGDLQPGRAKEMISAPSGPAPGFVIVAPELFKRAVLTGEPYPVRAAYVQVSNPVLAWSDSRGTHEALSRLDFLAVTETFLSPTAALADVVLPAATQLEYDDLGHFGLAHGFVLARPKVVDPPPECRPNPVILNDLAQALGLGAYWWPTYEDMLADILAPAGLTYADLAEKGLLRGPKTYYKYRDGGFKTPTGKVELALSRAEKSGLDPVPTYDGPPEPPDPAFPLLLTSHKSRHFFCSDHRRLSSLLEREPEPLVELHPDTARASGVGEGEEVLVETRYGCIRVKARVTEAIVPGVLSVVHGWWRPELGPENPASWTGTSLNVLTSSRRLSRALGTPNLRAVPARLTRAGE
ncbi:MAG: molybdopterin-dependent oxidoreductase [Thermodesulfobacteriota bacterium]